MKINLNGRILNPNNKADYKVIECGWLLASYADTNIERGQTMLGELSPEDWQSAMDYMAFCESDQDPRDIEA
jgi:hypothetical protein